MIECISASPGCSDINWEDSARVCSDGDCVKVSHELGKGIMIHFSLLFGFCLFFFFAQRPSRKYLINILSKTYEFRGLSLTFKAKTHRPLRTATHGKNERGGSGRCQVCRRLEPGTTLTSHITLKKYSNNYELDCNSNNVVYLIPLRCIRYSLALIFFHHPGCTNLVYVNWLAFEGFTVLMAGANILSQSFFFSYRNKWQLWPWCRAVWRYTSFYALASSSLLVA